MRTLQFKLWMDHQTSRKILQEAILDAMGKPMKKLPLFEKKKGKQICLVGYQGFDQHSPRIQQFAQSNPENFAQVLLFAPLTANTVFSRFNEWFPVLMAYLRKKDQVTREEVANYVSGIAGQRLNAEMPGLKGNMFPGVIDRGEGRKSALIENVWNSREALYERYMKMAENDEFVQMMREFAMLPGVQPVKAGFMVQMAFGQLGCLDVHNIRMYSSVADMMVSDPDTPPEEKDAWKEVKSKIEEGKGWNVEAKHEPKNAWKMDKAIEAYSKVLGIMHNSLGITPRELWNLWVNYVAQRYGGEENPDNAYSPEQGLVHAPDDPKLTSIFGHDRTWKHKATGDIQASLISPHPTSGAVSRVHLTAAISPEELLDQLEAMGPAGSKLHFINAALRSNPAALHTIEMLSERLNDAAQLEAILSSGEKINAARRIAAVHNQKLMDKLRDNAKAALVTILNHQYKMNSADAERIVDIYTSVLKKNYERNVADIASTLRSQGTKALKAAERFVDDDEVKGFGRDFYNPATAFDPGSKYASRLGNKMEPYVPGMQAFDVAKQASQAFDVNKKEKLTTSKKEHKELTSKISTLEKRISKLSKTLIPAAEKRFPGIEANENLRKLKEELTEKRGELRQTKRRKDQLAAAIKELEAEEIRTSSDLQTSKGALKGAGDEAINQASEIQRKRLHGY